MENADVKWLSIGEMAKKLGEPVHVVRYWSDYFGVYTHRTRGNSRTFTPEHAAEMFAIKQLVREWKFTLPGAKAQLRKAKRDAIRKAG